MEFSELEGIRVKLNKEGREEFWHVIDEFGGVKNFSRAFDIPSSKMYNWKSKRSYLPIELIKQIFGNQPRFVQAYKGRGRSRAVKNPVFPIPENNELLTRIDCSVNVNQNGIPVYQASDRGLVERFANLLGLIGEVPYRIYNRKVYELRYPKYLHQILSQMNYDQDLNALVDEEGSVHDGKITLDNQEINAKEVSQLYHREKRLNLALIREDREEIANIMSEEKKKIGKALKKA